VESTAEINASSNRRLRNRKPVAKIGSRYASMDAIPREHACVEVIAFTDLSGARRKRGGHTALQVEHPDSARGYADDSQH
jgi:hypothetical protein